jgi:hypothetical protein
MYQATQVVSGVCSKRTAYLRIQDLVTKGYLLEGEDGRLVLRAGSDGMLRRPDADVQSDMTAEHAKSARTWLLGLIQNTAFPVEGIKTMARQKGYNWDYIRKNRGAWGVESSNLNGMPVWQASCPQNELPL